MDVPRETEVKVPVADAEALRARLREIGAVLRRERHFEDNLLFDDSGSTLQSQGTVLRLRRTPHGGVLTFKGPREMRDGVKTREERETAVADPDALEGVLRRLGYRPVFRYQKYRESWSHGGQSVEIDDTPVGTFLEIEGDTDGIHAVASALGYTPQDYMLESYVALFFAAGGEGDMVFPDTGA
jgi:adenylate cyclase, class 2